MHYGDVPQRLYELFQRMLKAARTKGREKAEVHRSDIINALSELGEEEAVREAVRELQTSWIVEPRDWVWTRNGTYFKGAWFTDAAGYHRLYDDY
jgi:hypothetical protein